MGRTLRKLDLPARVSLAYAGQQKTGDVTLAPLPNQEYAAPVPDLKESVRFVVRAEDFRTSPRDITLVPPPLFTKLARTEYQPAYLHHAPPQGEGYPVLAGLRQEMAERALSLTGDRSVFPVPSGTEMVLTATNMTIELIGILPDNSQRKLHAEIDASLHARLVMDPATNALSMVMRTSLPHPLGVNYARRLATLSLRRRGWCAPWPST